MKAPTTFNVVSAVPSRFSLTCRSRLLLFGFLLTLLTFAGYSPISSNYFVNFDDPQYLSENPHVTSGLSWLSIVWAFTSGEAANWHPLTWVSHMLDCQLFGLNPSGPHAVNLLFHILNSLLLFALLYNLTAAYWRSGIVAALFALHPVHVESVAWISERKDVLSCFFFLLTLLAYVRYVRRPSAGAYTVALALFALALMSKPMVVTLPFVLLLLDFWPLRRNGFMDNWIFGFKDKPANAGIQQSAESASPPIHQSTNPLLQLSEKLPFFLLTIASCLVTYFVQKTAGAVSSAQELPLPLRLANAAVSYRRYLGKIFWPSNLACLYPYDEHLSFSVAAASVLVLGLVTLCIVRHARRAPFLATGWFWFLGTLVPVIGIVQVGSQAMADRYMYIPSIGLFVALVWGGHAVVHKYHFERLLRWPAVAAACALLPVLVCLDRTQVRYWQDSETLFRHAIAATGGNYYTFYGLGGALYDAGKKEEALQAYTESVRLQAGFADAQIDLARCLLGAGKPKQAEFHFAKAVALKPGDAQSHSDYGTLLLQRGDITSATREFSEALKLKPSLSDAHLNLGVCLVRQGDLTNGANHFYTAVQIAPTNTAAHVNLGLVLLQLGYPSKAAESFFEALRLNPGVPETRFQLAVALSRANDPDRALAEAKQARDSALSAGQPDIAKRAEELLNSLATKTAVRASL